MSIGVRTNDPELLDRLPECFPPAWEESSPSMASAWFVVRTSPADGEGRMRYELYAGDAKLEQSFRWKPLLERLDTAIRVHIARESPERLFVHAGVVAWRNQCIVIPGRSGAGKTTLVAALVGAGAAYYSDEYAVIDPSGRVHPYARPMSFRRGTHRRVAKHAVADLGGQEATEPLPLGVVLHTRYVAGARWEPRRLSPGQGALALFGNTVAARERAPFAFSTLARAVDGAVALEGDRGEAEAVASAMLECVDAIHTSTTGSR